jgi:hypothetical protein
VDTVLAGVVSALIALLTVWLKERYASYRIKREADLAARKLRDDAIVAAEKVKDDRSHSANEWLNKIIEQQEARFQVERKYASDDIQRLEAKFAKCEEAHRECMKLRDADSERARRRYEGLEAKYDTLARRVSGNTEDVQGLKKKVDGDNA